MKILKGNLVSAPALGKLEIIEHGCLVLHDDGSIQSVEKAAPQNADAEVIDYGDSLIMPSFVDMHLHAPQYPMLGMGMDLPLIDWLNTYTFKTEARFEDSDYARRIYKKLASDLITSGTTRVCMFSSLHTDATLILMEELEKAGVTGYVGKVNMDRNGSPELQETTEQSKRETLRWLDACGRFKTVKPILTPRFTPSCTDELMSWLGKLAAERGLYVQSHLSENKGEIAWVKELCPDCAQYWESYDRAGLWKDHTVMAHCVHSDEREREAMREHGVVTAHCAGSNINICSGVAPVRTLLREGNLVTLGSDIAGGALLAMFQQSLQANAFKSSMTYEILLIVVIGGLGSISGSVIASYLFIACSEWWLRFLDSEQTLFGVKLPLMRLGFRMVVFSAIIMVVVLFFRRGIMGDKELDLVGMITGKRRERTRP